MRKTLGFGNISANGIGSGIGGHGNGHRIGGHSSPIGCGSGNSSMTEGIIGAVSGGGNGGKGTGEDAGTMGISVIRGAIGEGSKFSLSFK